VDLGSITSGTAPEPDVRFTVKGVEHWAELVEVTDEYLAKRHSEKIGSGATEAISSSSRQQKGTLCDYQHVYYSLWPLWPPYSPNYSIP
jgi:hypothetical protein